jgi:hypothetical protein
MYTKTKHNKTLTFEVFTALLMKITVFWGYNAMFIGDLLKTFQRSFLPPSFGVDEDK